MADGMARRGTAKYDEQVWAGLIDDKRRYAELADARRPKKVGPAPAPAAAEPQAP